jgi:hypothetical protein
MSRIVTSLVLATAFAAGAASSATAQAAPKSATGGPAVAAAANLPDAKDLLTKADAAMGGRAAMDKHKSMHQQGTISIAVANISGALEIWRAKPNLLVQKQELGMLGTITTGYDGTNAWSNSSQAGPQMLDGDAANELKMNADFFADFYDATKVKSATTIGITDFEGKKAYEVKMVRLNDTESRNFFDLETGLRIGQSSRVTVQGQTIDQTAVIGEYKEFGGLKIPTKIVRKLGMADVVLEVTSVEFDNVDAKAFELPEAVKIIVKKP